MNAEFNKKIKCAIDTVIPRTQAYTIYSSPTGFDDMEVVRVITTAWKNLGKAERIAKVQNAVLPKLVPEEQRRIFRFSVLTPDEWEGIRGDLISKKPRKLGYRQRRKVERWA
jgi:hypothetical protein